MATIVKVRVRFIKSIFEVKSIVKSRQKILEEVEEAKKRRKIEAKP